MILSSINLGEPSRIEVVPRPVTSGIRKTPRKGPVPVGELGLDGDAVCDPRHHGGPDQAVYLYGGGDTAWWERELGLALPPGLFGENLNVSELESAPVRAGARFRIGSATLEATAPRIPCAVFARRMAEFGVDDPRWTARFLEAGRLGIYCRVLEPGEVAAGDPVTLEPGPETAPTMTELAELYLAKNPDPARVERALAAPIAVRLRDHLQRRAAG